MTKHECEEIIAIAEPQLKRALAFNGTSFAPVEFRIRFGVPVGTYVSKMWIGTAFVVRNYVVCLPIPTLIAKTSGLKNLRIPSQHPSTGASRLQPE